VTGLRIGADDLSSKPFEVFELPVRIESLRRRPKRPAGYREGAVGLSQASAIRGFLIQRECQL
jgi:DNA-binding response OmpR family regulator